jgi:hypothetical protein
MRALHHCRASSSHVPTTNEPSPTERGESIQYIVLLGHLSCRFWYILGIFWNIDLEDISATGSAHSAPRRALDSQ